MYFGQDYTELSLMKKKHTFMCCCWPDQPFLPQQINIDKLLQDTRICNGALCKNEMKSKDIAGQQELEELVCKSPQDQQWSVNTFLDIHNDFLHIVSHTALDELVVNKSQFILFT